MTDAHCHAVRGESRHFVCEPCGNIPEGADVVRFAGTHPWMFADFNPDALRAKLVADPALGVGEIGLDRLRERDIPQGMVDVFEEQLRIAAEFGRPVVLHGAKCWGKVIEIVKKSQKKQTPLGSNPRKEGVVPAYIFHGFSRSEGLLPDIFALNGYVSIGPAILNDHAVNYREMARKIPAERLLVETDCTEANAAETPRIEEVAAGLAEVRGIPLFELSAILEDNASRFASWVRVIDTGAGV